MQQQIELKPISIEDYTQLLSTMKAAYTNWQGSYWSESSIQKLLDIFPQGQIGVYVNDTIVGCALSIIVDYNKFGDDHTYAQITGNYTFSTHSEMGDTLYGIEVFIHPEYRGLRLGRRLYDARKELCEHLNLRAIVFGGRIPGYHKYSDTLTPKEYIQKVKYKELSDPVLSFQVANDFHVVKVLKNYMPSDAQSKEFAILLIWRNIYYEADPKMRGYSSSTRLGLIQWQMRPYRNTGELLKQVEYFTDVVSGYQCDFMVLPELFNSPLLAEFNHLSEAQAMREVAQYTEEIRQSITELAIRYNINIISGSMPLLEDGILYNVGYLIRRNGTYERYDKVHITPNELKYWGIKGGNKVQVFETDVAKIGILICYDVEFPELSRLLSDQGMEILFVPFLTDTQNAYSRVRHCAQARAVENECFVAIAGSVGNLPNVKNMDIQFAQSAVLTPCDYAFPTNGVKGEATANTEMALIADVDLSLLKELHQFGSVQNLKDRRRDLYTIQLKTRQNTTTPISQ
jgi:predicted amidohydrolase